MAPKNKPKTKSQRKPTTQAMGRYLMHPGVDKDRPPAKNAIPRAGTPEYSKFDDYDIDTKRPQGMIRGLSPVGRLGSASAASWMSPEVIQALQARLVSDAARTRQDLARGQPPSQQWQFQETDPWVWMQNQTGNAPGPSVKPPYISPFPLSGFDRGATRGEAPLFPVNRQRQQGLY